MEQPDNFIYELKSREKLQVSDEKSSSSGEFPKKELQDMSLIDENISRCELHIRFIVIHVVCVDISYVNLKLKNKTICFMSSGLLLFLFDGW